MSDDLEYYVDYEDHRKIVEELEAKLAKAVEVVEMQTVLGKGESK